MTLPEGSRTNGNSDGIVVFLGNGLFGASVLVLCANCDGRRRGRRKKSTKSRIVSWGRRRRGWRAPATATAYGPARIRTGEAQRGREQQAPQRKRPTATIHPSLESAPQSSGILISINQCSLPHCDSGRIVFQEQLRICQSRCFDATLPFHAANPTKVLVRPSRCPRYAASPIVFAAAQGSLRPKAGLRWSARAAAAFGG